MIRDKLLDTALEALHLAAKAVRQVPYVRSCAVDNDNDSGEIIFTVRRGTDARDYLLKLIELED